MCIIYGCSPQMFSLRFFSAPMFWILFHLTALMALYEVRDDKTMPQWRNRFSSFLSLFHISKCHHLILLVTEGLYYPAIFEIHPLLRIVRFCRNPFWSSIFKILGTVNRLRHRKTRKMMSLAKDKKNNCWPAVPARLLRVNIQIGQPTNQAKIITT